MTVPTFVGAQVDALYYVVAVLTILQVYTYYRTEKKMSTNQQRLNAIGTHLATIAAQNRKVYNEIVAKIDALKNQESELDFSALDVAVGELGVATNALDEIVPDEIEAEDPGTPGTPVEPPVEPPVDPTVPEDGGEDIPPSPTARSTRRK